MQRLAQYTTQFTAVLVAASLALIVPGTAGIGASFPLVAAIVIVGVGLQAIVRRVKHRRRVKYSRFGDALRVGPTGVLLASLVVLFSPTASAGELQALGGLCGLLGMLNYFLRPVYGLILGLVRGIDRTLAGQR